MQRFTSGLIVLILAVPLWAQKIETATPSRDRVVPIHTALDHLTVIEVGEPVVTVAAGSAAFKVEWRDNKVFIEPTEPGVSTNLFIWTASSRLNYELESAGEVGKMDFAIDYPKPTPPPPAAKVANSSGSHVGGGDPRPSPTRSGPCWVAARCIPSRSRPSGHGVDVFLKDLFEQNDTLFIRYEIRNNSNNVYVPGLPRVFALNGVHSLAVSRRPGKFTIERGGGTEVEGGRPVHSCPSLTESCGPPNLPPAKRPWAWWKSSCRPLHKKPACSASTSPRTDAARWPRRSCFRERLPS